MTVPRNTAPRARALAAALLLMASAADATGCPMPPPPVRDLALDRYYADEAGSVVDPTRLAEQRRASAPVRDYLNTIVAEADASLRQKSPAIGRVRAACAIEWLEFWARGGALLGRIDGKQAEAERRWTLSGAGLAYLKLKPHAGAEQRASIEAWLVMVANASLAAFQESGAKPNNHWYWLGLGHAATGMAAASPRHWDKAREIMKDAARDVAADGSLPLELARNRRALHYHAFALMPLVTMAELARARGEDWDSFGEGALGRLVALTAHGLDEPEFFDRLAGTPQERPAKPGAGWLQLYSTSHPGWAPPTGIETASGHRWLGGNVLLLHRSLAAGKSH